MNGFRLLWLLLILPLLVQCTTTNWVVRESGVLDEHSAPERVGTEYRLLQTQSASRTQPFLEFELFRIDQLEYAERVLIERTLQAYRPRWGFAALASVGSAIAFYAASGNGSGASGSESLAYYSAGTLLGILAVTNMRPHGEPIPTGETRLLRRSGSVILPDTVRAQLPADSLYNIRVEVRRNASLLESSDYSTDGSEPSVFRLADFLAGQRVAGSDPGTLDITVIQQEQIDEIRIPLESFMEPLFEVRDSSAALYHRPDHVQQPLIEVGRGSELRLQDEGPAGWYEVQFGGSALYVNRDAGEIVWRESESLDEPSVIPVTEVPFGEISVEFYAPSIKPPGHRDAALLLSNHQDNRVGQRRYLDRDLRLMDFYFREGFSIEGAALRRFTALRDQGWNELADGMEIDSSSTLYLYITGFATLEDLSGEPSVHLVHVDDEGVESRIDLELLLRQAAESSAARFVAFVDLDFLAYDSSLPSGVSNGTEPLELIAERVTAHQQNSALFFASRPDQRSGLYESLRFERKHHHLFPYYLAQGLQQGRTRLGDLGRFLQGQVDYTSRRLHDRPQMVLVFGDLTIDLTD